MKDYSATELANNTGDVLQAAAQDVVEITRHGKPRFVIMSQERYERLLTLGETRESIRNEDMSDEDASELIKALEDDLADD